MRRILLTLLLLTAPLALATTVYKWVDEDGVVHYSDQPHPNAQKVQLKSAQTYQQGGGGPAVPVPPPPPPAAPHTYKGCIIAQPPNSSDFANVDSLSVVVQTDPALHAGDQIYVLLDGQALNGGAPTGAQFTISPVERGEHTLQAVVKGIDGTVVCQTASVTYNVHQPSLLNPNNPIRPH
jgi:Domain of unknown function (DUF4124)